MNLLMKMVNGQELKEVPLISPEIIQKFGNVLAEHGVKKETIETILKVVQTDYFLCGTVVVTSLIVATIVFLFMKRKEGNAKYMCITKRKRKIKQHEKYNYGSQSGGIFR